MQAASLCMSKSAWGDREGGKLHGGIGKEANCMAMSKHLAVVLISNTEAHLVLIGLGLEYSGNHTWGCSLADV